MIHGDEDQIVPIKAAVLNAVKRVKNATYKICAGATHGISDINEDQHNADLLRLLKA
jgi:non-heme chloroperoxidase